MLSQSQLKPNLSQAKRHPRKPYSYGQLLQAETQVVYSEIWGLFSRLANNRVLAQFSMGILVFTVFARCLSEPYWSPTTQTTALLLSTQIHLPWQFYLVGQKKPEGTISSYHLPSDKWADPGCRSLTSRNPPHPKNRSGLGNTWQKQSVAPDIVYYFSCQKSLHLNALLDIQIRVRGEESLSLRLMKGFAVGFKRGEYKYFVRNWHFWLIKKGNYCISFLCLQSQSSTTGHESSHVLTWAWQKWGAGTMVSAQPSRSPSKVIPIHRFACSHSEKPNECLDCSTTGSLLFLEEGESVSFFFIYI